MESRDRRNAVESIIRILRKTTRLVQLAPFVYLAFYATYLILCDLVPDSLLGASDLVLYVSPATSGGLLFLSRLLKLCKFHKIACLIPFSSQIEGLIDCYLFTFTEAEIVLINLFLGISSFLFLAFVHKTFLSDGS